MYDVSVFPFSSLLFSVYLLAKQRSSIATEEGVIGAAWGEERLGIALVRNHHDSEDERVRVGMGWDG